MVSGALQFVVFIGVVVAVLLAAFVMLVATRTFFKKQSGMVTEAVRTAGYGIAYALSETLPLQDSVNLEFPETPYKNLKVAVNYWGVLEKTAAVAQVKNKKFTRLALVGGYTYPSERPALYLKDNHRPLVVVGHTRIQGKTFLPEAGIKTGNISGHSYYGGALTDGKTGQSTSALPDLPEALSEHLAALSRGHYTWDEKYIVSPKPGQLYGNSFSEETRYIYAPGVLRLQGLKLRGNIAIYSGERIVVDKSTVLKDVLLVAPEIEISDGTRGTFQAIATKSIRAGEQCEFGYPSALVVWENEEQTTGSNTINYSGEDTQQVTNGITVGKGSVLKGVVLFKGAEKENNYTPQVVIDEGVRLYGELYCNQNTELKGKVSGGVYTGNFIAMQAGSIYQNHLYDAVITADELVPEYVGLLMENREKGVAKWLY
ncbi:hypothetical protein SAMN02927921_00608 [Sinomicrobium oceani]|uniref:Uncharacterized protein n=2 Tax=Sinomicrobium oceani TaxID=1150368 RepID=A0A1K1ME97_9FLAO|nr:hypothetical protein SAMN02927921_00608 [Sinomicrobium oceani]